MEARITEWKHAVEGLWAERVPDYRVAAQLAAEIARSEDAALRETAAQALPSLRQACLKTADRAAMALAHRRLGMLRNALHALAAPRFGRRGPVSALTPQEHHRQLLGLPRGRRLFGPEIKEAYKRVAKRLHPDAGGSEHEFRELSDARDALMREL